MDESRSGRSLHDSPDTIAALATPPGRGAVAVLRVSGPASREILAEALGETSIRPRESLLRSYTSLDGRVLDRVLAIFFSAPRSYTGEDILEVSCHGGVFVARAILEDLLQRGTRLAEPGEFTLRAVAHGKMDLIQAEAVRDLVDSQTEYQLQVARQQLEGSLSRALRPVKEGFLDLLAQLETALEFVEEDVTPEGEARIASRIAELDRRLEELLASYEMGRQIHEGLKVVLAGRTNAGKSFIFNRLCREERALVTPVEGTTRDALREYLDVAGRAICLIDTAGIRSTGDFVEKKGIERSEKELMQADFVLFVVDQSRELGKEDQTIWAKIGDKPYVVVANKIDLESRLRLPQEWVAQSCGVVETSALEGWGLEGLLEGVVERVLPEERVERETALVTNLRQTSCLRLARESLEEAQRVLRSGVWSEEIVVFELQRGLRALQELMGEITTEDLLGRVFSSFCIGK